MFHTKTEYVGPLRLWLKRNTCGRELTNHLRVIFEDSKLFITQTKLALLVVYEPSKDTKQVIATQRGPPPNYSVSAPSGNKR